MSISSDSTGADVEVEAAGMVGVLVEGWAPVMGY